MKRKNWIVLLVLMMLACLFPMQVHADDVTVGYGIYDGSVYNGGVFDLAVHISSGQDRATYQWQVDASMGDDSWYDLDESNNEYGFHGTKTDHLKLVTKATDNSYEVGTGWEDIPFRCKVTLDGKTYYTSPMKMQFEKYSLFKSRIKKEDFGINTQYDRGIFNERNENGILYGEAVQGDQLYFWVSCRQPEYGSMYARSEVRFVPEIVINDNGKIKKAEQETTYVPTTSGKDILIVDYNIRMMIGINDLGIIDSSRSVITVNEPETSGVCYAKHDMSLLKEMYNESQKLASIPKNAEMDLIEISGGTWAKVLYGGYTGYVPSSSILIRELIPYVSVHVDDPAPGNTPYFTAIINGKGFKNYVVDPVTWMDKTTGKLMKHGEKFVEGHSYSVSIWLSALNEYEFDVYNRLPVVQATINGHLAQVKVAYEQDPKRVIELSYDYGKIEKIHVCTPIYVAKVNATCDKTGHEAYWHCECGKNYKSSNGQESFEFGQWGIIPASEHTAGEWKYNGTHHYRKCIHCQSIISGTTASHTGGYATCTQLAQCSICGFEYGQYGEHLYEKEWTAFADEGHVHLCSNKDCPAHDTILKHNKGPEATEKDPQICLDCGYIITPVKNHTHFLSKVEPKESTCILAGNSSYYSCSGCSQLFEDENGKRPVANLESVILSPLGHSVSEIWMNDEIYHYRTCENCGIVIDETKMLHEDNDSDERCDTCYLLLVKVVSNETSEQIEVTQDQMMEEPAEQTEKQSSFFSLTGMGLVFVGGFASALLVVWLVLKNKK